MEDGFSPRSLPVKQMKLNPPTQLVLFMFFSFAAVLGSMILLFRPPVRQISPSGDLSESSARSSMPLELSSSSSERADQTEKEASTPGQLSGSDSSIAPNPEERAPASLEAERELAELKLLKTDLKGRLRSHEVVQEKKIDQLARLCVMMEPGQAAATISELDEDTVRRILSRLNSDTALKIQSVLLRIKKGKG